MQPTLLELIACPECRGDLSLSADARDGDEILSGALTCGGCQRTFPIRDGVPRLLPDHLSGEAQATADAFGWQWKHFDHLLPWEQQRAQFLDWVEPLGPDDFRGKTVLDAGCGMGRLTEVAASFEPKHIIGVDLSGAVEPAWRKLRGRPNVHVIQGDIYNLPLRRGADAPLDLAYSVGVLHHLPEPERGYQSVFSHLKPGGRLHAWLYGKEGNAWVENVVTPIRERITSRLPRRALLGLSYALTLPLHAAAVTTRRVRAAQALPYSDYLRWMGNYSFRHNLHVVFDHLGPPIAYYLSREDLVGWAERAGARLLSLTPRNNNSWRLLAERPPRVSEPEREPPGEPPTLVGADSEWTPSAGQMTLFLALAVALLTHLGLGYRPFPAIDELAYLPASWEALGTVDYGRDTILSGNTGYSPLWLALTWLFQHTVGLATGFWLVTLALSIATVLAVRSLLGALSTSGWTLALIALIVFGGRVAGLGRGAYDGLFGQGFHCQWAALCLLLWSYVTLVREKPWHAGGLLGLAALAHPVVGLHGALAIGLGCLITPVLGWRALGKAALPAAAIAAPLLISVAGRLANASASTWEQTRLIQEGFLFRVPHEYLFDRVGAAEWGSLVLILALGLTGLRLLWRDQSAAGRVLGGIVLAHLTLLAGALILPATSTWVLLLHLTRTTPLLILLCVVCTVAGLQAAPRREHELADLLLIRVIQAGVLFLLIAFVGWSAALLPLAAVCLGAWLTARADQPRAAAAILILGAWLGLLVTALVDRREAELPPQEAALYTWAQEQPADAVFVVPPSAERFRFYARRSVYVDFKFFPASQPKLIQVWRERLDQVSRPDGRALLLRGWPAVPEWDRCYRAANTPARIAELLKLSGATYLLLEQPDPKHEADPRVRVAFENDRYRVYALR